MSVCPTVCLSVGLFVRPFVCLSASVRQWVYSHVFVCLVRGKKSASVTMYVDGSVVVVVVVVVVRQCLTPSCLQRATGGDRDPKGWGKREVMPNATLSAPERLLH